MPSTHLEVLIVIDISTYKEICDWACENQPYERIKIAYFFQPCSVINNIFRMYKPNKINTIDVEFNGKSSEVYRKCIRISERKKFIKIELCVICTHMVDFCRLSHI